MLRRTELTCVLQQKMTFLSTLQHNNLLYLKIFYFQRFSLTFFLLNLHYIFSLMTEFLQNHINL